MEEGRESRPFSRLGGLLDDFAAAGKPDGAAAGAFQDLFSVAVGVDVDRDAFGVVAIRAFHSSFLLFT